ncbi:MAG TPA: SIMPL domain-containing protein [Thermomicrobiales bacterium]|jgi:uncharacterized protein YggE|nr:SIMPL domain-containing protein [Thermomicrobiales bacterium]
MQRLFRPGRLARPGILALAIMTAMLVAAPFTSAQTPTPSEDVRTISVSGTGRITAEPDTADIFFGVESRNEDLSVAQDEVSAATEKLTTTLTENGVEADDIQTATYNITPVNEYDRSGNFERVDHYLVTLVLQVTVRDIEQVGTILDQGVAAGATYVGSISFYVADPAPYMSQAREAAVNDARTKADDYARLSGALITGVYSLEETSAPAPAPQEFYMEDVAMAADAEAQRSVPVSPGTTEIVVTVNVVYSIDAGNG